MRFGDGERWGCQIEREGRKKKRKKGWEWWSRGSTGAECLNWHRALVALGLCVHENASLSTGEEQLLRRSLTATAQRNVERITKGETEATFVGDDR